MNDNAAPATPAAPSMPSAPDLEVATAAAATRRTGFLSAVAAFTVWGSLPLYWNQIATVPSLEIVGHRVFWGGLLTWVVTIARIRWRSPHRRALSGFTTALLPGRRALLWLLLNGSLVVVNWLIYVWAVSNGRTLDASLGYYINPLVSVLLGMVFLGERLTRLQWTALASAATGVLFLAIRIGVFPWISLSLALTFGVYGLIKKQTALSSIHSLAVELLPFILVAAAFLVHLYLSGRGRFLAGNPVESFFLWGAGLVTVTPLMLFGIAARRIRLSDVGFLQYIAPTMMFVVAVVVFGDPLEPARLVGFAFVWLGLSLYTAGNLKGSRRT